MGRLLERVLHGDLPIAQVLIVHAFDGQVARLERVERHEAEALAPIGHLVPHDVRRLDDRAERREGIIQQFLVHVGWVEVADEQIRADVERSRSGFLVQRALANAHRPAE